MKQIPQNFVNLIITI